MGTKLIKISTQITVQILSSPLTVFYYIVGISRQTTTIYFYTTIDTDTINYDIQYNTH